MLTWRVWFFCCWFGYFFNFFIFVFDLSLLPNIALGFGLFILDWRFSFL